MTCAKAQGFLAKTGIAAKSETVSNKQKLGREEALALARNATRIVAMRGKNIVTLEMDAKHPVDDETLLAHLLGPTGNLRAPTMRVGKTLLVGFNAETYRKMLGSK
jgi:arsenate reductase-like glutaredoxin family protein